MAQNKNTIAYNGVLNVFVGGVDLGFTEGGVQWGPEMQTFDINSDQTFSALATQLISKTLNITINFAQADLEIIRVFLTGTAAHLSGSGYLSIESNDFPSGVTVGFTVQTLEGRVIRAFFHNCQVVSANPVSHEKGAQATFQVQLKAYPVAGGTSVGYISNASS